MKLNAEILVKAAGKICKNLNLNSYDLAKYPDLNPIFSLNSKQISKQEYDSLLEFIQFYKNLTSLLPGQEILWLSSPNTKLNPTPRMVITRGDLELVKSYLASQMV